MKLSPTQRLASDIIAFLTEQKKTIATAESCTGGLIGAALTDIAGASAAVYGGYITYANTAKTRMIGVPARLIRDHGAVSTQVARAMANGARTTALTDYAIGITGIAGPGGGSDKKPVGLVYIGFASGDDTIVIEKRFGDLTREEIRELSVVAALELAWKTLSEPVQAP